MGIILECITVTSTAILALMAIYGVFAAIKQIKVLVKQTQDDHERSRREKAVDLLFLWTSNLDEYSSRTRKFAENLSEENLKSIYNEESFSFLKKYKEKYESCFPKNLQNEYLGNEKGNENNEKSSVKTDEEKEIQVDTRGSAYIRWQLIKYLNLLESILSAWAYKIADKDLIEDQFSYLFKTEGSSKALKKFREIAGGISSYPSIELFEREMQKKEEKKLKEKYKLG